MRNPPPLPADSQAFVRLAAYAVHLALYALLLLLLMMMPIGRFLSTNAWGFPLSVFGVLPLPSPRGKDEALAKVFSFLHWSGAIAIGALILGHIDGALEPARGALPDSVHSVLGPVDPREGGALQLRARRPLFSPQQTRASYDALHPGLHDMNLRFVEAFVWVARLHSFKGAAERLFTTQAAISNRIATLETEVGIRLFERDNRSVELTRQGRMLLPIAEQMLALGEQFRGIARPNGKSELAGTLRIGVIDTVAHTWLPRLLSTFSSIYPKSTIELYADITPTLKEELLRGSIDCAVVSEEVIEAGIECRTLAEHPMVWVCAPHAPLPRDAEVSMAQLVELPIITFHRQSSVYKNIVKLAPRELRPKINSFSSMSSMISLVKAGFGVAALPLSVVQADAAAGGLRIVPVRPALAPLAIVVNIRSERNSPMLDDFLAVAIEVSAEWTREFEAYTDGAGPPQPASR